MASASWGVGTLGRWDVTTGSSWSTMDVSFGGGGYRRRLLGSRFLACTCFSTYPGPSVLLALDAHARWWEDNIGTYTCGCGGVGTYDHRHCRRRSFLLHRHYGASHHSASERSKSSKLPGPTRIFGGDLFDANPSARPPRLHHVPQRSRPAAMAVLRQIHSKTSLSQTHAQT